MRTKSTSMLAHLKNHSSSTTTNPFSTLKNTNNTMPSNPSGIIQRGMFSRITQSRPSSSQPSPITRHQLHSQTSSSKSSISNSSSNNSAITRRMMSSKPEGNKNSNVAYWGALAAALGGALAIRHYYLQFKDEVITKKQEQVVTVGKASIGGPFSLTDQDGNAVTDKDVRERKEGESGRVGGEWYVLIEWMMLMMLVFVVPWQIYVDLLWIHPLSGYLSD
eukprot:TRINITY_DN2889_c0_g1_i1.p1 TRINITY_DN2889_c0_g1~~TRINITY_DN2889_c0_g1_i1.p1  ORF type:complete len:250 (+),score=63.62 TRINITY_DN2889_c0_g1_i1:91-750(+)